jgi:GTP-binding protein EngB required for normal cell division
MNSNSTVTQDISAIDIENIINEWESKRKEKDFTFDKPVVLYVGDAGVGKSSCIKVMCNITDERELDQLNITDRGQSGTKDLNVYDTHLFSAIDIRGKIHNENVDDYIKYLSSILEKHSNVIFIIGVVNAVHERFGDMDSLLDSIKAISSRWEKPFIVLMNKFDQVEFFGKQEQFNERQKYLNEKCAKVRSSYAWHLVGHESFGEGVFPVSADRILKLNAGCIKCSEKIPCSSVDNQDEFPDAISITFLVPKFARHCLRCNTITVARSQLSEEQMAKITNYAQKKSACIVDEPTTNGLHARNPAFMKIHYLINDIIRAALIKGTCEEISQRIMGTIEIIRRDTTGIFGLTDAIERDQNLCKDIAEIFQLTETALTNGKYEADSWNQVKIMDNIKNFFQKHLHIPDEPRSLYIAAWGIYYARKFSDVASTIVEEYERQRTNFSEANTYADSAEKKRVYEAIAQKCNQICDKYTDAIQLEYYNFILQNGLDEALKKYILLKYKKTTALNDNHE